MLVSYRQLEGLIRENKPQLDHSGLFINYTLWNRESNRVYFFVSAGWNGFGVARKQTLWAMKAIWPDYRWIALAQIPYLIWVTIATVMQYTITWNNG